MSITTTKKLKNKNSHSILRTDYSGNQNPGDPLGDNCNNSGRDDGDYNQGGYSEGDKLSDF